MCNPCCEDFILYILEDHLRKKQFHAVLLCNIRVDRKVLKNSLWEANSHVVHNLKLWSKLYDIFKQ
jgi:hypothetical protein